MEKKVEEIFREVMELNDDQQLRGDMSSDNMEEWDSIASMSLVMKLEEAFGIKYEFDDIVQMDSLEAIKKVTAGKVQ